MTTFGELVEVALTNLRHHAEVSPRTMADAELRATAAHAVDVCDTLQRYLRQSSADRGVGPGSVMWRTTARGMAEDIGRARLTLTRCLDHRSDEAAPERPDHPLIHASDALGAGLDLLATHYEPTAHGSRDVSGLAAVVDHPAARHMLLLVAGEAAAQLAPSLRRTGIELHRRAGSPSSGADALLRSAELLAHASTRADPLRDRPEQMPQILALTPPVLFRLERARADTPEEQLASAVAGMERLRAAAFRATYDEPLPLHTGTALASTAGALAVVHHLAAHALVAAGSSSGGLDLTSAASSCGDAVRAWRDTRLAWVGVATVPDTPRRNPLMADAGEVAAKLGRALSGDPHWAISQQAPDRATLERGVRRLGADRLLPGLHQIAAAAQGLAGLHHSAAHAAWRRGYVLVPTRTLRETRDEPRPYARMPKERWEQLAGAYTRTQGAQRVLVRQLHDALEASGVQRRSPDTARTIALERLRHDGTVAIPSAITRADG